MNLAERQFWLDGKQLADVCGSKCGLITVSVFEEEHVFQVNCLFCPNVFSCFENFVNHIKIKHPPLSFKNLKKETDNESDIEQPDELVCNSLSFSDEFQNKKKGEYEHKEASYVSSSRQLRENQSNDDAEFMSEDGEPSMETLSSADPCKIEEFNGSILNKGSPLNTQENLEKTEKIVLPVLTSSRCQPIEESPQINLPKESNFHHQKNEIKLEYEESSDFTLNQEHFCNEVQENQSSDEFLSEDEHSVSRVQESSLVTSPKDSKVFIDWRIGDPKYRELTLDVINMWKCYPCLWDPKYDDYAQTECTEAWDAMSQSLKQKWNCEIQRDTLLRKICFLRTQHDQVIRNRRKSITSKGIKVPWFFKRLLFLAPQTYYCEECDRVFRSEDSFNRHKCTRNAISRHVCNVCNKELSSAYRLKVHKKMHVCVVVQENQSNDDSEFISEDGEHSMETLESSLVTFQNNSKLCIDWRIGDPKYRELTLDFIKMWKSYPCLWDRKCDCTHKTRVETLEKIRYSLKQKWNCEVPKDALLRKIRFMRMHYDQGIRNRRKATTSKDVRVPWFFKALSFLAPRTYSSCEECYKVWRSEYALKYHKYTHDSTALYVCSVCNKGFTSLVLLKIHKKMHAGEVVQENQVNSMEMPFHYPNNEIKLEYEETSNDNLKEEHLCNDEVHGDKLNDDAEFMSEDGEHSMEMLSSVGPCKIEELNLSTLSKGSFLITKEVLEKNSVPVSTSSQYQPVDESPQLHYPNNEIKLEYEETSNDTLNQEHLCIELQENQSNDYAEFLSEDEHEIINKCGVQESSHVTSPKDSKVYIDWRIGDPKHRELTTDFIKIWKRYPCLWDRKCDDYTETNRIEACYAMRHSLKQKWNCEIQRDTLLRKIGFLLKEYDQAVRNRKKATTSEGIKVPWFFKDLTFLAPRYSNCEEYYRVVCSEDYFNPHKDTNDGISSAGLLKIHKTTHVSVVVQENQVNSVATLESSHETSPKDSKVHKVWRIADPKYRELTLDVIKMWKSYPCLWDPKCDEYSKKKRLETWDTIMHSLKRNWNYEVTKDLLLQKIRALRTQYDQGVRSKRKAKNPKDVRVPWFFKELSFLEPHTYYCEECDSVFHLEDYFKYHKCSHDVIVRYVCKVCNTEFASVGPLKMHSRMHHGVVDSFECKLCGREFSAKFNLTLHLRWHAKGNSA